MPRPVGEYIGAVDPRHGAPSPGVRHDVDVEEARHGLRGFGDGTADDWRVCFEQGSDHEEEDAHPEAYMDGESISGGGG